MVKRLVMGGAWALCATFVYAQQSQTVSGSSVLLYGLLDVGVGYVTNEGGHSATLMDSGILAPNLLGFRGTEDLGGGTSAIFSIVTQFNVANGAVLPSSGAMFNREAYVGLKADHLGALTFGNQFDFMMEELLPYDPSLYLGGFYNFRQGPFAGLGIPGNPTGSLDFDRLAGATRVPNSVKYRSPEVFGLKLGAMYGFSNQPGALSAGDTTSFSLDYAIGRFGVGAAYTYVKYPQLGNGHHGIRNFGFGGRYDAGRVKGFLLYTNTKNTLSGAEINVYVTGATWSIDGFWSLGASYEFMKGNEVVGDNCARQFATTISYALSKRTALSLTALYQHASGSESRAKAWINALQPSSTSNQALVRVGMTTRF
ncbi:MULTISPECIES: porin [unclassified Burkholderia]|uniref:porin n=1 Tax=unclassified Burkholderia TaxID=2613784 RepID=UPI002AB16D5D|nr:MULTISPECIES: porin [unclassified Burkholderia]